MRWGSSLSSKVGILTRARAPSVCLLFAILAAASASAEPARAADDDGEPVVVEMYVSQACKKSPDAVDYAAELARRPDLVAITFHIDYWNVLTTRKNGRWSDPFGEAAFSARQRNYNRSIRGRGTVFTPQAIVGGAASEVGSKRQSVEDYINLEKREQRLARTSIRREGASVVVTVDPSGNEPRDVYLVRFMPSATTQIPAGENAGRVFDEHNVARSIEKIGSIRHRTESFTFPAPKTGEGCAVLVQDENQGRIVGARYCP